MSAQHVQGGIGRVKKEPLLQRCLEEQGCRRSKDKAPLGTADDPLHNDGKEDKATNDEQAAEEERGQLALRILNAVAGVLLLLLLLAL